MADMRFVIFQIICETQQQKKRKRVSTAFLSLLSIMNKFVQIL